MNFETFYKNTFDNVYKYFYYKSIVPGTIEDLAQEAYLRFHAKYCDKLADESESTKILYGICRNIYKEWVRQQIREKRVEYIDEYDYALEDESTAEEVDDEVSEVEIRRNSQKQAISEAMKSLNDKVRLVLEYRFLHGMSRKEIAEKLQMKEKDVHTYQKRGVKYLNKLINK